MVLDGGYLVIGFYECIRHPEVPTVPTENSGRAAWADVGWAKCRFYVERRNLSLSEGRNDSPKFFRSGVRLLWRGGGIVWSFQVTKNTYDIWTSFSKVVDVITLGLPDVWGWMLALLAQVEESLMEDDCAFTGILMPVFIFKVRVETLCRRMCRRRLEGCLAR